jgi:hypothetical protein
MRHSWLVPRKESGKKRYRLLVYRKSRQLADGQCAQSCVAGVTKLREGPTGNLARSPRLLERPYGQVAVS